MSCRIKITFRLVLALLLVAGIATAIINQKAISQAKQENQKLVVVAKESQGLATENGQLSLTSSKPGDIEGLRQENSELPKLRNEVRQLRRQTEDLEKLREEHKRLLAQQNSIAEKPMTAALPAGFISKAALTDAGQATPEAAVQTMFWAMCQGDVKRIMQCALGAPSREPRAEEAEEIRQDMKREMEKFPGFAIAEKKMVSENEAKIGIQSSANGSVMQFTVERKDGVWKLDKSVLACSKMNG